MVPRADDISYYYIVIIIVPIVMWSKNRKFWRSCSIDSMYNNMLLGVPNIFLYYIIGYMTERISLLLPSHRRDEFIQGAMPMHPLLLSYNYTRHLIVSS